MFKQDWERLKRVLMFVDAVLTAACFIAAYGFREAWVGPPASFISYLTLLAAMSPIWVVNLAMFGAYRSPVATPVPVMVQAVAGAGLLATMEIVLIIFAFKLHFVSRLVVFSFALLNIAALLAARGVLRLRRVSGLRRRILVIGTGARARRAVAAVAGHDHSTCDVVGYLDVAMPRAVGDGGPMACVGTVAQIADVLKENVVDEIVLAVPRSMIDRMENVVRAGATEGVRVRIMADFFEAAPKRLSLDECGTVPFLTLDWVAYEHWKLVAKRVIDVMVAATALAVTAPLLLAIAVAIKLDSVGPVLFAQVRMGRNKRTFRFLKFRTMCVDAERRQADLEALNEAHGPVFKIANDPRVTRVGRILRRTSLDELPQLWNVLLGDMSLVGPRPLPLRDVSRFDQAVQRKRFSVKPGLTCLWQVSGRSNVSFAEWLRLDLWYIDNWSLTLDLKLLARTVPAVLKGTGAV